MSDLRATISDVRYAYRLFLGREAGEDERRGHDEWVVGNHVSVAELCARFQGSREYLQRNKGAVEIDLDDFRLFVGAQDHDIGRAILNERSYEPHVSAVLRDLLKPHDVFIDVGANIGYFTCLAARLVGTSGQVVAVEPMDKNLQLIYRSMERNGFANIRVEPFAVGDRAAVECFLSNASTSNGQMLDRPVELIDTFYVQARTLDELTGSCRRIDVVKLDIEGFEFRGLRGFGGGLARHRPILISEFHPHCMRTHARTDPIEFLEFLFLYGKTVGVISRDGPISICKEPAEVMQLWRQEDARWRGGGKVHIDLVVRPEGRIS